MTVLHDEVNVLVVGAGAAGAAFTWRLASLGVEVTCLEQGDWQRPESSLTALKNWESKRIRERSPNPNIRRNPADYPILDDTSIIKPAIYNGVGGSTILWSAHTPRFRPSDFRVQSLDGVGADWPITYWDLAEYYEINDEMMGTSGLHGDPGNPPRAPRTTPPVPLGIAGSRIAEALNELKWHWWPSDGNILTQDRGSRRACNGCGPCEMGCATGARASVDITYWPEALALGAELRTGATVRRVLSDATGKATGVEWIDITGQEHVTHANIVVMAGNGIGTPRILLNSASKEHPRGLGNSSDQLGRNLMLHPIPVVTGVFDEDVESWSGNDAFALLIQEFYENNDARDFKRGYEMQVTRGQGPLITALGGFSLDIPWGKDHHEVFERYFGRVATVAVTCEDLPHPNNKVTIDSTVTDRFDIPAARMWYELEENSKRMISHGVKSATDLLRKAGARETHAKPFAPAAGFHLMGTARMGSNPEDSFVDQACRSHDVPNLLVIDGSVFASAAAVNPTPTLQAVALRAADLLREDALV
ncbi:MAG: GMC family oxidoreductase [Actinobacteria bacterium]|nr:GMC family oxidoreductase [Actinomycetota bacterium]NBP90877.1 GMC family oxidoreductase [Actinomycetota bacterium]